MQLFAVFRGFQSTGDSSRWNTVGPSNPLSNITPVPPSAEGKAPQTTLSQASYQFRPSSKCKFADERRWFFILIFFFFILGTQADQDSYDEEARHQARESLTQSWKDRLSAISLIVRSTLLTSHLNINPRLSHRRHSSWPQKPSC